MLALYLSSVDLVLFLPLLPLAGQSVDGQSVDAVGCRSARARQDSSIVAPTRDSRLLHGTDTVLNITSALLSHYKPSVEWFRMRRIQL